MFTSLRFAVLLATFMLLTLWAHAEDGYRLWLRYDRIENNTLRNAYTTALRHVLFEDQSPTADVLRQELRTAYAGLLGGPPVFVRDIQKAGTLLIGTAETPAIRALKLNDKLKALGDDGFIITVTQDSKACTVVAANTMVGVLYGTFELLARLQRHEPINRLNVHSMPAVKLRLLNHWDNLDRTVERGYAGFSLWDWHRLPGYIDERYIDYARANASIGINGTVLTNVNANAQVLTPMYLEKAAALASVFRPYGIKVFLTARFSAPVELGGLRTADPLDKDVQKWWHEKAKEIYKYIPDFGGFVVKANSEGQPGPQNYGRSHADGANMLAAAVSPFGGVVMWRAFVYDNAVPEDRAKQAYSEFKPLDGKFHDRVMVQVKNGPIDFQPREPFHPLFGAMPRTPLMMEFQITQEYLGQATNLVYLAPLFKECLDANTHTGDNITVAKVVDGSLTTGRLTGMAGVANIGNDRNWCGHPFAQANWYAFGKLAWNHGLSSAQIADDWIRMTFSNDEAVVSTLKQVMSSSREILVLYMTPVGLHHIMGYDHHYGPAPWIKDKPRADWTSVYYHRADSLGVGFDRTATGSNALEQYAPGVQAQFGKLQTCPEKYLLWFHHVRWDHRMQSGRTLWEELCYRYHQGADSTQWMQRQWDKLESKIDTERFKQVKQLLAIQRAEALWWRDACLLYFQTFSRRPFPPGYPKPAHTLAYYQGLEFPFAPGIKPRW